MNEQAAGQFIDLRAFTEWVSECGDGSRLPAWSIIRSSLPNLAANNVEKRRRLFITHRWDSKEHPDPTGWQLKALFELGSHYNYQDRNVCFWYDYMSLPQKPRQGEEKEVFSRGLEEIRTTVQNCENITLVSRTGSSDEEDRAAMLQRGWILFELLIARLNRKEPLPLYESAAGHRVQSGRYAQTSQDAVVKDIATQIPFDSAGLIHAWFQQRGVVCTDGSDLKKLSKKLYIELTEKKQPEPNFKVRFDVEMRLTHDQLCSLEILESSRLSGPYPELYLKEIHSATERPEYPPVWIVRFARRPEMPPLNVWIPCGRNEVARRLISATEMRSPMYPGVTFEFKEDYSLMRASLQSI